jgi:hypothetical protein
MCEYKSKCIALKALNGVCPIGGTYYIEDWSKSVHVIGCEPARKPILAVQPEPKRNFTNTFTVTSTEDIHS